MARKSINDLMKPGELESIEDQLETVERVQRSRKATPAEKHAAWANWGRNFARQVVDYAMRLSGEFD